MSTVDEWARRYFREEFPVEADTPSHEGFFSIGAETLAALLLSDEAVEAAHAKLFRGDVGPVTFRVVRAALTAALTKITEDKE